MKKEQKTLKKNNIDKANENVSENETLVADFNEEIENKNDDSNENLNTKKSKNKNKKKMTKQKHIYSAVLISLAIAIGCGGVGLVGGYFLHNMLKPEVEYTVEKTNLRALEERAEKATDLLEEFKDDPYNLVNYSLIKFSKKKTTLVIGNSIADNFSGRQNVYSATINTPEKTFSESISSTEEGAIINLSTAFRFYDEHNEVCVGYEYDTPDQWFEGQEPTKNYTYDEFIEQYGKLHEGLYTVDEDKKFKTLDYEEDKEGELICSATIFQITKKSVKNTVIKELDNGNIEISLEMYSNRACYYSARQIKGNGRLAKLPVFGELVTASFILDSEYNVITSTASQPYRVTVGLEVDVTTALRNNYYWSETDTLIVQGQNIKIPTLDESFPFRVDQKGELTRV